MAEVQNVLIERASIKHVRGINSVIIAAKSHWPYPESYLRNAIELLKIDAKYLKTNFCFEVLLNDKLVGFFSVADKEGEKHLDHLWIHPSSHGLGLGRRVCEFIFSMAQKQNWGQLLVMPDLPATEFYKKMGFSETGTRVPSRVRGGPVFSVLKIHLKD